MLVKVGAIIFGVVTLVIGLTLSGVIIDTAAGNADLPTCIFLNAATASSNNHFPAATPVASARTPRELSLAADEADECGDGSIIAANDFEPAQSAAVPAAYNGAADTERGFTGIRKFAGASALNNLIPLIYFVVVVMIGVGMIGIGGAGFAGRGPLGNVR